MIFYHHKEFQEIQYKAFHSSEINLKQFITNIIYSAHNVLEFKQKSLVQHCI